MTMSRLEARAATERRVRAAAAELFLERGTATAVRDIAQRAGVSVGSVMAVGDKNALLVRVVDDLIGAAHGDPGRSNECLGDPVEAAVALVRPFLRVFFANEELARAYAAILVSGSHSSDLFDALRLRLLEEFTSRLGLGHATAAALYFAYVGVLFASGTHRELDAQRIERELRDVFSAIIGQGEGTA